MKILKTNFILAFLLACNSPSENNSTNNFISAVDEHSLSLNLVDSIAKNSKEYYFYTNISLGVVTSPILYSRPSSDSIFSFDDYHSITAKKLDLLGSGSDFCYSYSNGKIDKILIRYDVSNIYGYNLTKGGNIQFTLNNPFGNSINGYNKIIYADTSVIFILEDNLRKNGSINDPNPISNIVYKYDVSQKVKSEFFRTSPIRPLGAIFNYSHYYINKISEDKFLFAAGIPSLDHNGEASLNSLIFLFESESRDRDIYITNISNRSLDLIPESYNSFLFQLTSFPKFAAGSTTPQYPSTYEIEYLSIGAENMDVHVHKNPFLFTVGGSQTLYSLGNYYFLKTGGIYFVSKDLANFYPIPYKKNKTILSQVIYVPVKNKYYYIEIDNNKSDKIYIYEIKNLDSIN